MAKKKVQEDNIVSGGSFFDLVNKVDKSVEIIADSAYSNIPDWINTGNYILNACISGSIFGGVPAARVSTLCGTEGCLPKSEKIEIYILKGQSKHHELIDLHK